MSDFLTVTGLLMAAGAFTALALSLRPGKGSTVMPRMRLRVAALFSVAWAAAAWINGGAMPFDPGLDLLLSISLIGIWVWQLDTFAQWQGLPRLLRLLLQISGAAAFVFALGWMLLSARTSWLAAPSYATLALAGVALATLGLVTIEQLYRNAPRDARDGMRWLGLGMGGVMLIELVTLAEKILLGTLTVLPDFVRGGGQALSALAMVRGARLMPRWQIGMSVSRHVVFYAGSFLMVGAYLLLMAVAGWVILRFANGWQAGMELAFLVLAGLGLGLSLFSGGIFRRLKVLISAHFYPQHYDYRLEWMRFTRTMSEESADTDLPRRAVRALAQLVGSQGGNLWRATGSDAGRFSFSVAWPAAREPAVDPAPVAADDALPSYLQRTAWLVDLTELALRPGLYGDLRVDAAALGAAPDALIVPLLHGELLYGWITLDRAPDKGDLNFEDRDLLKTAGRQVAAHLAQADAAARLAEANQFDTYNRMTAFVMHDLKNIAAQLRLISQNAERHRRNPEFVDDAFRSVAASAARMTKLISQLAGAREGNTLQTVDLATCAERATLRCGGNAPVPQLVITSRPRVFADQEHLGSVIEHAIRNAQEATPASGEVRVEVSVRGARPLLTVTDTGTGMDAQFVRERLFRPFDTTKGTRGMGIGAFQIRDYLRSLGGDVEVRSQPGKGTSLTLLFADQSLLTMGRMAV